MTPNDSLDISTSFRFQFRHKWVVLALLVVRALKKPLPPLGVTSTTAARKSERSSARLRKKAAKETWRTKKEHPEVGFTLK